MVSDEFVTDDTKIVSAGRRARNMRSDRVGIWLRNFPSAIHRLR